MLLNICILMKIYWYLINQIKTKPDVKSTKYKRNSRYESKFHRKFKTKRIEKTEKKIQKRFELKKSKIRGLNHKKTKSVKRIKIWKQASSVD